MSNKKDKQKILNNEVNEEKDEKLGKVSGGKNGNEFTARNLEKRTQETLIDFYGYPK